MTEWIFGYGSLVTDLVAGDASSNRKWSWAKLLNFRRNWGAAMENAAADADAKFYVDDSGVRPDLAIAFLDVYPSNLGNTNGVIFEVDEARLIELDRREIRYSRTEVTEQIVAEQDLHGRVWTYRGNTKSVEVAKRGKELGRACASREYVEYCAHGFNLAGKEALHDFNESTDPLDLPVFDLTMVRYDEP